MAHAEWMLYNSTNTHSECVILCISSATKVAWTRLNFSLYVHSLSCCYPSWSLIRITLGCQEITCYPCRNSVPRAYRHELASLAITVLTAFRRRTTDAFLCRTVDLIPLCPVSIVENAISPVLIVQDFIAFVSGCCQFSLMCRCLTCRNRISGCMFYSGADKSLARPGRKQTNASVRMACISFGALPCRKKKLDDSSHLEVVQIARFPDTLPSWFPSWLG